MGYYHVNIAEMVKYPKLLKPKDFVEFFSKYEWAQDIEVYVQPKWDGSNITCYRGVCLTRNHYLILGARDLAHGLLRGISASKLVTLLRLSYDYQIFFELGGYENAPAGYKEVWGTNWDAWLFDVRHRDIGFLKPTSWTKKMKEVGVNTRIMKAGDVLREWFTLLGEFNGFEGFVVKVYDEPDVLGAFGARHNMIAFKFKHEYIEKEKKQRRKKEKKKEEELPELEESEVRAEIERLYHEELGEKICDKSVALPKIAERVREEAKARGARVPRGRALYKLWLEFTFPICGGGE